MRSRPDVDEGSALVRDAPDAREDAPHLVGRGVDPTDAGIEAPPDAETTPAPGEDRTRVVLLEGTVEIEDADVSVLIDAQVPTWGLESVDGPWIGTRRVGPGAFRLDVTDIVTEMRDRDRRPRIDVSASAPGYVGPTLPVLLSAPEAVLAGDERLAPVTLVLRRAAVASGTVRGPGGGPVEGAAVRLYAMTADGPEPQPVAETASDGGGAFTIGSARGGRHLLVATWLAFDGQSGETTERPLPASLVVDLEVGKDLEGTVLRLRPSFALRGSVRVDGAGAGRATVYWRPAGEVRALGDRSARVFEGIAGLFFLDGRAHWGDDPVVCDARGRFTILGASAIPYRVYVRDVPGAQIHRMSREAATVEVTPPTDDLLFDLRMAKLVLLVRKDGRPYVPEEKVHLSDIGMHPELGDDVSWGSCAREVDVDGRCEFGLTPAHKYVASVEEPGYRPFWRQVEASAAGETLTLTVDLVPEEPKPFLVVRLEGEGVEALEKASFGFYEPEVDPMSRGPWPLRQSEPLDGLYLLEDLVPGRHRLVVRPGRYWHDLPGDWLDTEVEVRIPRSGEAEITVPVARGGRLQIVATDVDGRHLESPCTVRGPDGNVLRTNFVVREGWGPLILARDLPGMGPAWVARTLPAGTYEITLEPEGYQREIRTVEIHQGRPTTLRVTLRRP